MRRVLVLIGAIVWSVACNPTRPSATQAQADVRAMTFTRHANGLCFGVIRFTTYTGFQGTSVTLVPGEYCKD